MPTKHSGMRGLQELEGGEMGPLLCCTRMPCLLAIPPAPGLSCQGNLEGKPVEAQGETGFSRGVSGAAVSSEGSAEGGPVFKLSHMAAGRFLPIRLGLKTPSVPCHESLSQEQFTIWELASSRVSKQERADKREGWASLQLALRSDMPSR